MLVLIYQNPIHLVKLCRLKIINALKLVISGKADCAPISSTILDELILKGELNHNDIK